MPRLTPALLGLAVVSSVTTGCAGSSGHTADAATSGSTTATATKGADGVQQITIDTTDKFRFTPMAIRAQVGKLRIVLTDNGSYPHNISFPSLGETSSTVSGNPGRRQTTVTVTFARPGTYRFVCTFHSSAGMRGEVTVS